MRRILLQLLLPVLFVLHTTTSATSLNVPLSESVDPHLKRNQTIGLILTQGFFDDLQYNLIVPAILNIQSLLNLSFQSPFFANLSIMTLAGNGTSVAAHGLHIANDTKIFQLNDGYVTFNITDLIIDLNIGYEFISDPPIVADLGFLNLTMEKFDMIFNMTSFY